MIFKYNAKILKTKTGNHFGSIVISFLLLKKVIKEYCGKGWCKYTYIKKP